MNFLINNDPKATTILKNKNITMKTKSFKLRILFILMFFLFTSSSVGLAQNRTSNTQKQKDEAKVVKKPDPKPDKSTTDALSTILNGPKSDGIYKYADREILQKNIKSSFLNWNQKGEFEKQSDYELRKQKESQSKFTEVCIEEIKKIINSFRSSDLNINLLIYDAENEIFPTVSKFKEKEWENQVRISIDKAQNFKEEEWSNFRWQKEESSWCFISNDIFPSIIYLESSSFDITFKLPLPNQEQITIAFNDLGLENTYLKDFIFNYSLATEKERENKIYSPNGIPSARIDYETGRSLDGNGNYQLGGRKAVDNKIIVQKCYEAGIVVVSIEVDRNGKVINATPGVRGTTNNSKCLTEPARQMAMETKFNSDPKAPLSQIGKIIYRFSLSE